MEAADDDVADSSLDVGLKLEHSETEVFDLLRSSSARAARNVSAEVFEAD